MSRFSGALIFSLLAAGPAIAQDSAVRSAADAFGERVGIEQLGLYNEGQVRGFDLQASGAYRINDAYFARASPLNDPVLAGVGVRVGVNASRLAYPAPSGVVNYRLRDPSAENGFSVGGGLRDFGTATLQANGSWSDDDARLGFTGGVVWRPEARWEGGQEGQALDLGLVGRLRISENQTLRAFASYYTRRYDGDAAFKSADGALPPIPRQLRNLSPEWARVDATNMNFGVLYDADVAGWSVDLSAFRSVYEPEQTAFTIIEADADGSASGLTIISPPRTNVSHSGEARVSRVFEAGDFSHLISGSVRARRSTVDLASSIAVPLGAFDMRRDAAPAPPPPAWSGARGEDVVEQVTGSVGYGLLWRDRLQVRFGAHRTRYEKRVLTLSGDLTQGVDETTLYNASAVWSFSGRTSLFGSWVTGLEETGFAPQNATNRNEVLSPVEAEQFELGLRHALTDRLTLIGAVFEVSKPTTGFRPDGSFGLVGEVAHRGVEGSLAGRLGEKTNVVLGAVVFDPDVTGTLVDAGLVGGEPAGLSKAVVNASVERQLSAGWTVDAQLSWYGERWVDTRNTFKTPDVTLLNLGARRSFELGGRAAQLRLLASNVFNERGYWASPSTLLWPIAPRTVRALLTVSFGPRA